MGEGYAPAIVLIPFMAALLVASAFASGSETALFGLTHGERVALRRLRGGQVVERLLARPRRLLICVLLLNMVANVLYFAAAALLVQGVHGAVATAVAAVVPLVVLVLVGEVLAKLVAATYRLRWSRLAARPLLSVSLSLGGLLLALDALLVAPLARLFAPAQHTPTAGRDQLRGLLEAGNQLGAIGEHELDLLGGVVGLSAVRARAAMAPRVDLRAIDPQATPAELARAARETGRHRLPATGGDPHVIERVVDIKRTLARGRPVLDKPVYVPENARLDRVLVVLRQCDARTAVCVDEHGESTGMLEATDLLRALVRLSVDPGTHEAAGVYLVGLGVWSVPGRMLVADLFSLFDPGGQTHEADTSQADTVGGLMMARLGRLCEPGDRVGVGGLELEAEHVTGRAVERVIVRTGQGGAS